MQDSRSTSGLPSAKGSPFKSGNFNKFFFGITLAAILLGAIVFAVFAGAFHHGAHPSSQQPKSEFVQ